MQCWVHKTANVLAKLPKSQQPKAKRALQEIWMAETKADAEAAFDAFIESYQVKYEKAAECLNKDRDVLLTWRLKVAAQLTMKPPSRQDKKSCVIAV
jgi:transposase-like protein